MTIVTLLPKIFNKQSTVQQTGTKFYDINRRGKFISIRTAFRIASYPTTKRTTVYLFRINCMLIVSFHRVDAKRVQNY